jgi:hypothetical protein
VYAGSCVSIDVVELQPARFRAPAAALVDELAATCCPLVYGALDCIRDVPRRGARRFRSRLVSRAICDCKSLLLELLDESIERFVEYHRELAIGHRFITTIASFVATIGATVARPFCSVCNGILRVFASEPDTEGNSLRRSALGEPDRAQSAFAAVSRPGNPQRVKSLSSAMIGAGVAVPAERDVLDVGNLVPSRTARLWQSAPGRTPRRATGRARRRASCSPQGNPSASSRSVIC